MKIGFIGCVESSKLALEALLPLESEGVKIVAVVTKSHSVSNSDHVDLTPICESASIPVHCEVLKEKDLSVEFMKKHSPDVIFCFGWSFLLGKSMLSVAPKGVIGFHPAKLPKNRGRHPLIWALALGLESTASTFFLMDEGADSGPIISQVDIPIEPSDCAKELYDKVMICAVEQITTFVRELAKGVEKFQEQNSEEASYWRKRTRKDGLIDFRMNAKSVHNLVRALSSPYPGAEFIFEDRHITVWKSEISESKVAFNLEPGLVIESRGADLLIKCADDSAVWLIGVNAERVLKKGDYL